MNFIGGLINERYWIHEEVFGRKSGKGKISHTLGVVENS